MVYAIPPGKTLLILMKGFVSQYNYVKVILNEKFEFSDDELYDLSSLIHLSNELKQDINYKIKFGVFKKHSDTYQQGLYLCMEELSNFII